MAALTSLPALLESLTTSLSSAYEMTPQLQALPKPKDGISLLDAKNELLLSYLQNLVFLILMRIRRARQGAKDEADDLDEQVLDRLVELRLFLEKGARPLEGKLQYTITQFLKAAQSKESKEKLKSTAHLNNASASEDEDDDDDSEGSDEEADEEEEQEGGGRKHRAKAPARLGAKTEVEDIGTRDRRERAAGGSNGVYRPPMRERKLMDPDAASSRRDRRPQKSHTMDEYIATELSSAPMAEPSIGTTIVKGGRKTKSSTERAHEDERREYEEANFTRLPAESKKDRKKRNAVEGRSSKMMFGGEEWHGLGAGVDRIDRLTRDKGGRGKGSGVRALLDKSRKRGPDTVDGPRGDGMGDRFNKRVKTLGRPDGSGKKKSW